MGLNWSVEKVKDRETVCFYQKDGEQYLKAKTESLIFYSMSCGYSSITEKNVATVAARVLAMERIFGASVTNGDGTKAPITVQDIKDHIGLSTNASNETEASWRKRMMDNLMRDIDWTVRRELRPQSIPEAAELN